MYRYVGEQLYRYVDDGAREVGEEIVDDHSVTDLIKILLIVTEIGR